MALATLICAALPAARSSGPASAGSAAVSRKLNLIENHRLPAGSRVEFTRAELTEWTREQAGQYFPGAVRNPRLDFGSNAVTGYADVDFVKLRQATSGEEPGWIMRNLFSGERPVVIKARLSSAGGRARVDVDLVEISGVSCEGRTLDFLIRNYVQPTFPEIKVAEWFGLSDGVDRIVLAPSGASVFMGR